MQHMKISVADTGLQVRVRPGNPDSEMGGGGGGGGNENFRAITRLETLATQARVQFFSTCCASD